jgi:drug/metabolite transporter (DMT)-like permease
MGSDKALNAEKKLVWKGLVYAVLGAIGFSGKAILIKLSYAYGVDSATLIMYRMLFALPFFLVMALWSWTQALKGSQTLTRQDLLKIVFMGFIGYYLSSYLDFLGLNYVSAGLERLILYLSPSLVLLLSWLVYKRPVTKARFLALALSYAGVVVVFAKELSLQGQNVLLGSALVFMSASTYAVYLMLSEHMLKKISSLGLVGSASLVASLCCIVQFLVLRPMSAADVPVEVIHLSILNALFCTVLPIFMVMKAIELMGPALTSQIGMIGPMSTILMGYLFLNEPLNVWTGLGTLLVLSGVFCVSKFGEK